MGNYSFWKDLERAKEDELELSERLKSKGAEILEVNGKTKSGDILVKFPMEEEAVWVEMKTDFMAHKTGNVVVEYECRGKPSGIMTTESKFWIYKFHGNKDSEIIPEDMFIFFPVEKIRQAYRDLAFKRVVNGGDRGSNTMMYLFKVKTFKKYGTVI